MWKKNACNVLEAFMEKAPEVQEQEPVVFNFSVFSFRLNYRGQHPQRFEIQQQNN